MSRKKGVALAPRKQRKTAHFNARITPELRVRLERSAAQRGVSLSEEIESRLELSFALDAEREKLAGERAQEREAMLADLGGPESFEFFKMAGTLVQWFTLTSEAAPDNWLRNRRIFERVRSGLDYLLERFAPEGEPSDSGAKSEGREMAKTLIVQLKLSERDTPSFAASELLLGPRAAKVFGADIMRRLKP